VVSEKGGIYMPFIFKKYGIRRGQAVEEKGF